MTKSNPWRDFRIPPRDRTEADYWEFRNDSLNRRRMSAELLPKYRHSAVNPAKLNGLAEMGER